MLMSLWTTRCLGQVRKFWRRLMRQLIADVPEEIAVCEFDCRECRCTLVEWAVCEKRKRVDQFVFITSPAALARGHPAVGGRVSSVDS
jgi:hypothetical protein